MYPWHIVNQDGDKVAGFNNQEAATSFLIIIQSNPVTRALTRGFTVEHDDVFEKFLAQEDGNA